MTRLLCYIVLSLASTAVLQAQPGGITVTPPELYPGWNELTVTAPGGIQEITSVVTPNTEIEGSGIYSCEKETRLKVFVNTASQVVDVDIKVRDCRGNVAPFQMRLNTTWNLDTIRFGIIETEKTGCKLFRISLNGIIGIGGSVTLDSVTTPLSNVRIKLPTKLPLNIPRGSEFKYEVCFDADEPGLYTFPVITWIRRPFPSGGWTTYPVADTGVVRVVKPNHIPDPVKDWLPDPPLVDPTTFRSVAVPNAIIPKKGKFFLGSYDLLGLVGGYSFTDNVMLLAGGAVPLPDDWGGVRGDAFGAYSIGAKGSWEIGHKLNLAAGYQVGRSVLDKEATPELESSIFFHAPYGAISYGDDSSRVSATVGYVFKRHRTFIPDPNGSFFDEYNRDAPVVAIGGDYQFARGWKVAGEAAYMKTLGVLPIIGTVRYFGETYAIDAGIGYVGIATEGAETPAIPVAPILSAVFVF